MKLDSFEATSLNRVSFELSEKMSALRSGFENRIDSRFDLNLNLPKHISDNISNWLGIDKADRSLIFTRPPYPDGAIGPSNRDVQIIIDNHPHPSGLIVPKDIDKHHDLSIIPDLSQHTVMDTVKNMYHGIVLDNGKTTRGLLEIHNWKINPDYYVQNLKQHAGYAAEVISTTKENLKAKLDASGLTTYRADDRPDLFPPNDQYVDKIRVDNNDNIIEKIQVKFVGKDGKDCLSKFLSKKYDKYFNDGIVDKMEVPKDYYDQMKKLIPEKLQDLEEQLQHVKEEGKTEVAKGIEAKIDRFKKIDQMLEKSMVSSEEAIEAVKHPKRYMTKLFAENAFANSYKAGKESAVLAAAITTTVSTVDNFSKVMDGEMTVQEAFVDVTKDVGTAGGLAFGTTFVSTTVVHTMASSGHQLIRSLGNTGVPAAVISFGVESFDSINDFASGIIDGKELACDLGENAVQIGGSIAGSALAGAAVGSVVPGAGTVVGFGAGLVGGMIGCAVASEAYTSALEVGAEHIDELANKAQEMADRTVEIAAKIVPDHVGDVVSSIKDFAKVNNLPIKL